MKPWKKKGNIFSWSLNSMLLASLFHNKSQHTIQANKSHISTNTACRYKMVHCRMVIQLSRFNSQRQHQCCASLPSGRRAMAVRCFQVTKPMAGKVALLAMQGACYWMDGNIMRHQSFVTIDLSWAIKSHLKHHVCFAGQQSSEAVCLWCRPDLSGWQGMPLI